MSEGMNFAYLCKEPPPPLGRSVAIIGAGPSGLAATGYLACQGYEAHLYDKLPKPGGLMVFGIPGHRIPEARVAGGVDILQKRYGVKLHMRTKICGTKALHEDTGDHFTEDMVSLGELTNDNDAVMICTGTWSSRKLRIPGEDLEGVYSGLQYLFPIRALQYNVAHVQPIDVKGKRVAVVGAGHSAVDVVHSALSHGAEKVYMLYRRTRKEAPCGTYEISQLEKAGAEWKELVTPTRIIGSTKVEGIEMLQCSLGEPDESGRACPIPDDGSQRVLPVDFVVAAIGEVPTLPFAHELGLDKLRKGDVHWLQMTSMDGVFVAGDALTGPSKIGKAIYSGMRAASSLARWLDLQAQNRSNEYDYDKDYIEPGALI